MHAISSYRGNTPTNKHTHRQDRLQYTAQLASAQCNDQQIYAVSVGTLAVGRPNLSFACRKEFCMASTPSPSSLDAEWLGILDTGLPSLFLNNNNNNNNNKQTFQNAQLTD